MEVLAYEYRSRLQLRADPASAGIPVVAISANVMPLDIERGLKAGSFRYLTKPITVDEFTQTLDVSLDLAGREPAHSP